MGDFKNDWFETSYDFFLSRLYHAFTPYITVALIVALVTIGEVWWRWLLVLGLLVVFAWTMFIKYIVRSELDMPDPYDGYRPDLDQYRDR